MTLFTSPATWHGGSFDLALELGEVDDIKLYSAFSALWSHPALQGIYLNRIQKPEMQEPVAPDTIQLPEEISYGLARISSEITLPIWVSVVREPQLGGSDWLYLSVPMGAVHAYYQAGRHLAPIQSAEVTQLGFLEGWLAGVGQYIFAINPFALGIISYLASGMPSASDVVSQGVPVDRYIGYLWPENGVVQYLARNVEIIA